MDTIQNEDNIIVYDGTKPMKNPNEIEATRPSWMTAESTDELMKQIDAFYAKIVANPNDLELASTIYQLGQKSANSMMPHTKLFDEKVATIMEMSKNDSPLNTTLLSIKQELDTMNPAMLPISTRFLIMLKKFHIPKAEDILEIIYAKHETVKSTIDGLNKGLWKMRDDLQNNIVELASIYQGLLSGQRLLERDIYFGQILHGKLNSLVNSINDPTAKMNVESVLSAVTTQIINLQTEEQANIQFFAGAQAMAKINEQQVSNITNLTRIMKNAVLANLGLRVVTVATRKSMQITEGLKEAIGDTMADTAKMIRQEGEAMTKARSSATISIDKLRQGFEELNKFYEDQAKANQMVISEGQKTSKQLAEMTETLSKRINIETKISTHSGDKNA